MSTEVPLHDNYEIVSLSQNAAVYLFTQPEGSRVIYKVATHDGASEMRAEIRYHLSGLARGLPLARVLDYDLSASRPFYVLEFYPGGTLADRICEEDANADELSRLWADFCLMLTTHFYRDNCRADGYRFGLKAYCERPASRLSRYIRPSSRTLATSWADVSSAPEHEVDDLFLACVNSKTLRVDDARLEGPLALLKRLAAEADEWLRVPVSSISNIHGDPHSGNVVYDDSGAPLLIDCGAFIDGGDIAYDLGKVLLSCSWYNLIVNGFAAPFRYRYDGAGVEITGLRASWSQDMSVRFSRLSREICGKLMSSMLAKNFATDPLLASRTGLAVAIHLIAIAPHHLAMQTASRRRSRWYGVAILLEGVLALNRWFERERAGEMNRISFADLIDILIVRT